MSGFRDQVVVITGAGGGIGRALALAYAAEGARLHLVDIDGAGAEAVAGVVRQRGAEAVAHEVDCARGDAVEALAAAVYGAAARVDVLHNNAGVVVGGAVADVPLEDWRWIVDTNLWSVIHAIRAFVPRMVAQGGGGQIVNTASIAGLYGLPYVAPYCATKFAVVGLSEALDAELAPQGIRVSAVCPSAVRTGVMRVGRLHLPGRWGARLAGWLERYAPSPEHTAGAILRVVRRGGGTWVGPGGRPLWWLKRGSVGLYQALARGLATRALRSKSGMV